MSVPVWLLVFCPDLEEICESLFVESSLEAANVRLGRLLVAVVIRLVDSCEICAEYCINLLDDDFLSDPLSSCADDVERISTSEADCGLLVAGRSELCIQK